VAALEGHHGEPVGVEEVRRAQVRVTVGVVRVDTGGVHAGEDTGRFRLLLVQLDVRFDVGEAALHGGDHEVLHTEANLGVRGVEIPGHGSAPCACVRCTL